MNDFLNATILLYRIVSKLGAGGRGEVYLADLLRRIGLPE